MISPLAFRNLDGRGDSGSLFCFVGRVKQEGFVSPVMTHPTHPLPNPLFFTGYICGRRGRVD
jgi:hypothetical protein